MQEKPRTGESRWDPSFIERVRGKRMRQRRQLLNLSQAHVTALLPELGDGNGNVIGRIENGDVRCFDSRAVAIARVLRVPMSWLYCTDEWEDVDKDKDPYLDKELAYIQILGIKRVKKLLDAIGSEEEEDTVEEILRVMVRKEIMTKGVDWNGTAIDILRGNKTTTKATR